MVAIALPDTAALRDQRRPWTDATAPARRLALVPPPSRDGARSLGSVVVALVLVAAVVVAGAYLARTPEPAPGGSPSSYVVAEGDTLWSIAQATAPAGEAATYVEALVAANGSGPVAPGQVLTLPDP